MYLQRYALDRSDSSLFARCAIQKQVTLQIYVAVIRDDFTLLPESKTARLCWWSWSEEVNLLPKSGYCRTRPFRNTEKDLHISSTLRWNYSLHTMSWLTWAAFPLTPYPNTILHSFSLRTLSHMHLLQSIHTINITLLLNHLLCYLLHYKYLVYTSPYTF